MQQAREDEEKAFAVRLQDKEREMKEMEERLEKSILELSETPHHSHKIISKQSININQLNTYN